MLEHVRFHLGRDEPHSADRAKRGIASVVGWGSCVCAEWELCGAWEVALKTFEMGENYCTRQKLMADQTEGQGEIEQLLKNDEMYAQSGVDTIARGKAQRVDGDWLVV